MGPFIPLRQNPSGTDNGTNERLSPTRHFTSPHLTLPHLVSTSPHLDSPRLTSTHLTSPRLTLPHLTSPHRTSPYLTSPHLTSPHLTSPHHTSPLLLSSSPRLDSRPLSSLLNLSHPTRILAICSSHPRAPRCSMRRGEPLPSS
ncbi:hypothetical protein DCS_06123 [Drechmeria coniospora]|uniref:Uncharacterized protein n=1 Tax=Drechmeria coniospora TaxID=98403 RepID=A0A151GAP3_DRECN|nr:hypothetical protein DCS_06123 [Drechmeria coniospora]KYK54166.1 hypothetical protein DCS_06123 [Drechmeria coniospora]